MSAEDGQEPSPSAATPKRHWVAEPTGPTATATPNEPELLAGVDVKSFALLGGDRLGMLISCALTDPNRPGGIHAVGYYLTVAMPKGDQTRPDYELLGPLWDLPNLRGEHVEGKLAYDTKVCTVPSDGKSLGPKLGLVYDERAERLYPDPTRLFPALLRRAGSARPDPVGASRRRFRSPANTFRSRYRETQVVRRGDPRSGRQHAMG